MGRRPGFTEGPFSLTPGAAPVDGYRLVTLLGRGGFGEVWKAEGPGNFTVALKFVPLGGMHCRPEMRGLDIVRSIRHPNLLPTFGAWEAHGYLIIAMELADGTLMDRWREAAREGRAGIPLGELLGYFEEAAKGIDYLNEPHSSDHGEYGGVQHRDIKPQNILLVGNGVKVADFGLARILEQTMTGHTGSLTPAYAAPEFFHGQTSAHSDQYCLAVTWCHLRGGRLPFTGNPAQLLAGHLNHPPDLSMLPESERPAVVRALAKDPHKRWPSCRAFIDELTTARSHDSSPERDSIALQPTCDWSSASARRQARPTMKARGHMGRMLATCAVCLCAFAALLDPAGRFCPLGENDFPQLPDRLLPLPVQATASGVALAPRDSVSGVALAPRDSVSGVALAPREKGRGALIQPRSPEPGYTPPPAGPLAIILCAAGLAPLRDIPTRPIAEPTPLDHAIQSAAHPPALNDELPPPPHLTIAVPTTFTLRAGESKLFPLGVEQAHCRGAVRVGFQHLPAGIRAPAVVLPPTARTAMPVLYAAEDAAAGDYQIEVDGANEGVSARSVCQLTVLPRTPPPVLEPPPPPPPVVVRPAPVLRLSVPAALSLTAGTATELAIQVERQNVSSPVELHLVGLPEGVRLTERLTAAEDSGPVVTAHLVASGSAVPGATVVTLEGSAADATARRSFTLCIIKPPVLTLTAPRTVELLPGEKQRIEVQVARDGFDGPVSITGDKVPPGLSVQEGRASAGEKATEIVLEAALDALPGESPLRLAGHGGSLQAQSVLHVVVKAPKPGLAAEVPVAELSPETKLHYFTAAAPAPLVICSPNGLTVGVAEKGGGLRLIEAATGNVLKHLPAGGSQPLLSAGFTPDGGRVYTLDAEQFLTLWDIASAQQVKRYRIDCTPKSPLDVSASGHCFLTCKQGEARVWNVETGQEVCQVGSGTELLAAVFAPDEQRVLLQPGEGQFRVFDVDSGHEVHQYPLPSCLRTAGQFSADGRRVCAVGLVQGFWKGSGSTLRCLQWDVVTGAEVAHADAVVPAGSLVALSRDGGKALTAGRDGSLHLWDTANGKELQSFPGHPKGVVQIGFSRDGRRAFSAGVDGYVRLWQLP